MDTFVWSGGDVTLAGSVRTTPNACALYTPTVGAPPDVNCARDPKAVRFHLDAGESGTITLTGLPSTVLGFLAGRRLLGELPVRPRPELHGEPQQRRRP